MVFGKAWAAANGFNIKSIKEKEPNIALLCGLAFVL